MPTIELITLIAAPPARVFDLARCIDLHAASMAASGEAAVAGVTRGLIGPGQSVTWRARHFGVWQTLTSQITAYSYPDHFRDSMVAGAFRRFDHDHYFDLAGAGTRMRDRFDYTAPLGPLGCLADGLFLAAYMRRLLAERNRVVKAVAESSQWRQFLGA